MTFEAQVKESNYTVVTRQYQDQSQADSFANSTQMYGEGNPSFGFGTYTYEGVPTDSSDYGSVEVTMALKSEESKILDLTGDGSEAFDSRFMIAQATTGNEQIDEQLRRTPDVNLRRRLFSTIAVQLGYDAVRVHESTKKSNYLVLLNRTAVIIKGK